MSDVNIRDATVDDLEPIRAIYNEVLMSSTAIFSDVERTAEEQRQWFEQRTTQGYPVLVADRAGCLVGFASYGSFRTWPGYRKTVENSVYLSADARGRGIGARLLDALLQRAMAQELHAVIAGIDGDNVASMRLHAKLGFTKVAHLKEVGRKWNRWLDLVFYERLLTGEPQPLGSVRSSN